MSIIVGALLVIPAFFLWTSIHELSHLAAAKLLVGADLEEMKLYPHVDPVAGFRWGSVQWRWKGRPPTDKAWAGIMFAPRLPNLAAALGFPFVGLLPVTGTLFVALCVFVGAGLVDLGNGSMGMGKYSDLRRGAGYLKKSPWLFRIAGFSAIAVSVLAWLATSVDNLLRLW